MGDTDCVRGMKDDTETVRGEHGKGKAALIGPQTVSFPCVAG
jgi:hypothetical protein